MFEPFELAIKVLNQFLRDLFGFGREDEPPSCARPPEPEEEPPQEEPQYTYPEPAEPADGKSPTYWREQFQNDATWGGAHRERLRWLPEEQREQQPEQDVPEQDQDQGQGHER